MPEKIKKIITSDSKQLAEKGAEIFCKTANQVIAVKNRFAVAISGGSTPRAMHRLLAQEPYVSDIPWQNIHLFWVDERMVAFDHPDSNFGSAKKDFLNKILIPPDQVHPMPAMELPEEGAKQYQEEINSYFTGIAINDPIFDLIILGIGKDGHIASLFPGQSSREDSERSVISVKGGQPNVSRLTLTYPVLNSARHILFLASGKEKASVVKSVFEKSTGSLPVHKIIPEDGKLTWILDREAASLLS
jgi:6-phosphogluconolactonase